MSKPIVSPDWPGPAEGCVIPERGNMRRVSIDFDMDTFGEIRAHALKTKVSLSEQIRVLVEIGLEELKA